MEIKKYLEIVADIVPIPDELYFQDHVGPKNSKQYISKFDKSYITFVGMEDNVQFLADREITEELTHGVGYSPKDNKWYGWSHRAIYGFEIGSTCKKGNCHYRPSNEKDLLENAIAFWSGEGYEDISAKRINESTIEVSWIYSNDIPNEKLRGKVGSSSVHAPIKTFGDSHDGCYGRGEWTAETMEDAKQMAIDFNEGVS